MKHRVINRDKIVDAWIEEPYDGDEFSNPHGWRIGIQIGKWRTITKEMDSESDCINFINSLNFVKI